jgi:hypothetical protein
MADAMEEPMIDRTRRDELADAIHLFLAGYSTNDDFDDWLTENELFVSTDPSRYADALIGPIVENAWCLYSDTRRYRLVGRDRPGAEERRNVLRWIMFLRSDLEYEWPPQRFVHPFHYQSGPGCLVLLLTLGLWTPGASEARVRFDAWTTEGDFAVWPYRRREDFEEALRRTCPLARSGRTAA